MAQNSEREKGFFEQIEENLEYLREGVCKESYSSEHEIPHHLYMAPCPSTSTSSIPSVPRPPRSLLSSEAGDLDTKKAISEFTNLLKEMDRRLAKLADAQQESDTSEAIRELIDQTRGTLDEAKSKTESLTANVIYPDNLHVKLVPVNLLDHLEEVRSDINIAYLSVGTWAGAVLGILISWGTDENFTVTRVSLILMTIFGLSLIGSLLKAQELRKRGNKLKEQMEKQMFKEEEIKQMP